MALPVEYCPHDRNMFARVIAASKSAVSNIAIYTVHLRYPRIIHGEVMTHRVFGRNARSSRAVPVATMLAEVREKPFIPWHWHKNQPGMQGTVELSDQERNLAVEEWTRPLPALLDTVERLRDRDGLNIHKQVPNRLLEPYTWIDVLVTATEWNNFFHLRDHGDAEPHMQDLARIALKAIERAPLAVLKQGEWHLPYIGFEDWVHVRELFGGDRDQQIEILRKVSAARCARISYAPFDGNASYERELERYNMLVGSDRIHASPLEHQATPDTMSYSKTFTDFGDGSSETVEGMAFDNPDLHGNLSGWIQSRKLIKGEAVYG